MRASACAWRAQAAADSGASTVGLLRRRDLGADVAEQVGDEREVEQALLARAPSGAGALQRLARARRGRSSAAAGGRAAPTPRRPPGRAPPRARRPRPPAQRAHVLVDARRVAVRRRPLALLPRPVAHRARGGAEVARLPEGERQEPEDLGVARVGVARVDEPPRRELEVALGERVLGRGHEALDAVGARVGLGEVDELQRARGHRPDADVEGHARPLLHVVAVAREVDAVDAAHAPLRIGEAARVAVHDRVVGQAGAERVVLGAVGLVLAPALVLRVRPRSLLRAPLARRGGADLDGVARHAPAAEVLREALELVGRLVDRLQVALVLELAARRGDVRVPALGQLAARELDVALVERRIDLQEQDGLLDVQHLRHDP